MTRAHDIAAIIRSLPVRRPDEYARVPWRESSSSLRRIISSFPSNPVMRQLFPRGTHGKIEKARERFIYLAQFRAITT